MPTTRAFKSGNSQAIRILAELACADTAGDLHISRMGDVITIYPIRRSLREAVARLRALPKAAPSEARQPIELTDRDWD